jgi:hypothetical protein
MTKEEHAPTAECFNAAIDFALEGAGHKCRAFLDLWREGMWDEIAAHFPEFKGPFPERAAQSAEGRTAVIHVDDGSLHGRQVAGKLLESAPSTVADTQCAGPNDRQRGMMLSAIADFMAGVTGLRPPAEANQVPPEVRPHVERLMVAMWSINREARPAIENTLRRVVVLCGSMRDPDEFARVNRQETLAGHIVLAPCPLGGMKVSYEQYQEIEALHRIKIMAADEVVVVGHVGRDTQAEIEWAQSLGKPIRVAECKQSA